MGLLPPISVFHVYGLVMLSSINMPDHEGEAEETYIHIKQRTCSCVFKTHINTQQRDILP
jgi:hypothetical protein